MKLGSVIRRWRTVENKTLDEVAKEIGIGTTVLQRIETGGQGGKGKARMRGTVEMNGNTLGKILVWLLNGDLLTLLMLITLVVSAAVGQQVPVAVGDVFLGTCDSPYADTEFGATVVFGPTGVGVGEFYIGNGENVCASNATFDAIGDSYIISDSGGVYEFDPMGQKVNGFKQAPQPKPVEQVEGQGGCYSSPCGILHDAAGNVYMSVNIANTLRKYDAYGQPLVSWAVDGKAEWITLTADQSVMIYSALNGDVKSFNLITQSQGPDLIIGQSVGALRVLPDQQLIVNNGQQVSRWAPGCQGCTDYRQIITYNIIPPSGQIGTTGIALDPDGTSFWTVRQTYDPQSNEYGATAYRLDIQSGAVVGGFQAGTLDWQRKYSGSIAVYGDGMNGQVKAAQVVQWKTPVPLGGTSVRKSVTVKNTGLVQIVLSGVGIRADDGRVGEFRISDNRCMKGIRPASHCNVWVTYTPTQVGTQTGVVEIFGNIPGGKQVVQLVGIGQ